MSEKTAYILMPLRSVIFLLFFVVCAVVSGIEFVFRVVRRDHRRNYE